MRNRRSHRSTMNSAFQLILLPGLGADHRLLEPQRKEFPQLVVPAWIPPQKNESLPHYAAPNGADRCAAQDRPLVLGGVSFGGMLAYEMARHLKPHAVVLIASCRTRQGLRPVHRAGRWLLPLVPVQAWSIAKLLAGPVVSLRVGARANGRTWPSACSRRRILVSCTGCSVRFFIGSRLRPRESASIRFTAAATC